MEGYDDDDVDGVPMPGDHDGMPLDLEALDKQKEQEEAERQAKLKFQASKWETVDESTLEAQVRNSRRGRRKMQRRRRLSAFYTIVTSSDVPKRKRDYRRLYQPLIGVDKLTFNSSLVYLISSFENHVTTTHKKNAKKIFCYPV